MSSREQRERELWQHDAEVAKRIVHWFDVLMALRGAADTVPAEDLIASLRKADPAMLERDRFEMMVMFRERFQLAQNQINRGRKPKITAEKYAEAWERSRDGGVSDVARKLGVERSALYDWLKKNPHEKRPKK